MANSDTYKTFGRHTQTGKLLYNIYNAHQRNTYKPNVKLILNKENTDPHEEHLTKLRKERQILKDRKNTPISDPSLPKQPTKIAKIFSMRGRKPKNIIENELEDIEKETSKLPIPKRMCCVHVCVMRYTHTHSTMIYVYSTNIYVQQYNHVQPK